MYITIRNNFFWLAAITLILLLGVVVRGYQLTSVPPSLSWDEVAVGYNAWSVANFSIDEWGHRWPLTFTSFEDDKHPVHIYITALFEKFLGLNPWATRLPAVVFGCANILLIFLVINKAFSSKLAGLGSAFFMAISPYAIHFSRMNHEFHFVIFFFLLGLFAFFQSFKKPVWFLLACFSFGIDLLTYHPAIVVVPIVFISLLVLYAKEIRLLRGFRVGGVVVIALFLVILATHPALLGFARASQTNFSKQIIEKTLTFRLIHNPTLARFEVAALQYPLHFSPSFLFIKGDHNPRLADQVVGEFYLLDLLFLAIGLYACLLTRSRAATTFLIILLIGPLPSSLTNEAPHAARSLFILIGWLALAGFGVSVFFKKLKSVKLQLVVGVVIVSVYSWALISYQQRYYQIYPQKYANDWQYGLKDIVEYVKEHPDYGWVYTTDVRAQPYIFYLYYLQVPPKRFLSTVEYNVSPQRSANLVTFFDHFHFGDWNIVESKPIDGTLYAITDSEYDGLRQKSKFNVKKVIRYPDGGVAFRLVTLKP